MNTRWEYDKIQGLYRKYWPITKHTREYTGTVVTPSPYGKGYAVFKQGQLIVCGLKLNEAKKY